MSLFEDLINQHIKELEELKKKLHDQVQAKIKQRSYELLSKYSEEISNAQSQAILERERILYEALVESRRIVAEAYEEILNAMRRALFDYIDKNRTDERYIKFLEGALLKARELIGNDVVIQASPRDKNAIIVLMGKLGMRGDLMEKDIAGGIIASSRDSSVVMDATIDTLLETNVNEIKKVIAASL